MSEFVLCSLFFVLARAQPRVAQHRIHYSAGGIVDTMHHVYFSREAALRLALGGILLRVGGNSSHILALEA